MSYAAALLTTLWVIVALLGGILTALVTTEGKGPSERHRAGARSWEDKVVFWVLLPWGALLMLLLASGLL